MDGGYAFLICSKDANDCESTIRKVFLAAYTVANDRGKCCQPSDDHINGMLKNKPNRRRTEMEVAVSTLLAGDQLTAWDVFGD